MISNSYCHCQSVCAGGAGHHVTVCSNHRSSWTSHDAAASAPHLPCLLIGCQLYLIISCGWFKVGPEHLSAAVRTQRYEHSESSGSVLRSLPPVDRRDDGQADVRGEHAL